MEYGADTWAGGYQHTELLESSDNCWNSGSQPPERDTL